MSLTRAEGRQSSASKRKGAGGGVGKQERQMARVCTNTPRGLPSPALLRTCPMQACKTLCVPGVLVHPGCSREGRCWETMGATARAPEKMDRVCWCLR